MDIFNKPKPNLLNMTGYERLENFTYIWIAFALLIFPVLLFVKQPYGRHVRKGWGPTIPNNAAWILMEIPSLLIIIYIFLIYRNFIPVAILSTALWVIHYFNRTLIFPFQIKTKGKTMPLIIAVFGIFFNLINASLNGIALGRMANIESFSHADILLIIIGLILFISGMFINISSDRKLINLRKSSTNGYKIPVNGMFEWISCPNYFGEILEWIGFAVIAGNLAAVSFAIWTIVNLVPRAIDHHKWYKQYFAEYPKNRKAIIPFIL